MKIKSTYIVYKIEHLGKIIYVGRTTNNVLTRQNRHNNDFKKGVKKALYTYLNSVGVTQIELIPIYEYSDKIHSKRMEMKLLLDNYFENNMKLTYYQRIPNIKDGI